MISSSGAGPDKQFHSANSSEIGSGSFGCDSRIAGSHRALCAGVNPGSCRHGDSVMGPRVAEEREGNRLKRREPHNNICEN